MVQYTNGASNSSSWNPVPTGNIQGICPVGWHIPTDVEWCTLTTFLDSTVSCSVIGSTGTNIGGKLKEKGLSHWQTPNTGATNQSLFYGLPSGGRISNGTFSGLFTQGGLWTTTEYSSNTGFGWGLGYNIAAINRNYDNKATGLSVRCMKDCSSPASPATGSHIPSPTQIIWNWTSVPDAEGYKWSTTNDFSNATDMGTNISYTETGLTCMTGYQRYVWAYKYCGHSDATVLYQSTTYNSLSAPVEGNQIPSPNQITWQWNAVIGAAGYLLSSNHDFTSAINIGTNTSYTEQGLSTNTSYTRYVSAISDNCGSSPATTLHQSTTTGAFSCSQSVSDPRDPQPYNTILIGNQCWMQRNMNVGTLINPSQYQQTDNQTLEKYCYNNDPNNCDLYGGYYQWGEMVQYYHGASNTTTWSPPPTEPVKGICPEGWQLPGNDEWCTLLTLLDPTVPPCWDDEVDGTVVGAILKDTGPNYWASPNNGTNYPYYFTALGGGGYIGGWWGELTYSEIFWSITPYQYDLAESAACLRIDHSTSGVFMNPSTGKIFALQVRCMKDCTPPSAPAAATHVPFQFQIIWNWNAVQGQNVTGYRWSNSNNYDYATDVGSSTSFTQTGLSCNTVYTSYVWSYTDCSHSLVATVLNQSTSACPPPCTQPITDSRDPNNIMVYNVVLIGSQCWMAKNLNYGTRIDGSIDQTNNTPPVAEKYCYNDDPNNCDIYGGLYQWGEVVQYYNGASNTSSWTLPPLGVLQGLCPNGWHIPKQDEFGILVNTICGDDTYAGYFLKEPQFIHWDFPNPADPFNLYGYTALGAGCRAPGGIFSDLRNNIWFWTCTECNNISAISPDAQSYSTLFPLETTNSKTWGMSIRCIRDN